MQTSSFSPIPALDDKVSLWQGNITHLEIDAIVNTADAFADTTIDFRVNTAILKAGGESLLKECLTLGVIPTGQTRITSGHHLPAKCMYMIIVHHAIV